MSKDYFIHRAGTAEVMEDGFYELSGAEKIASDLAHQNPGVEFYVAMRYTRFLVEPARPAYDGTATELAADTAKVMLRGLEQAPGRVVGSNPERKTHCRLQVGECVCAGLHMDDCENAYTPGASDDPEVTWRARIEQRLAALEKFMWPLQSHQVAPARVDLQAHRHAGAVDEGETRPNEERMGRPWAGPVDPAVVETWRPHTKGPICKGDWRAGRPLGTACGGCSKCITDAAATPPERRYEMAVVLIRHVGKASPSFLQRRLYIGYNEACDLIERMEREGIVSRANHAGKRELLKP